MTPAFRSKSFSDGGGVGVAALTPAEPSGASLGDTLWAWTWLNAPTLSTFAMTDGNWSRIYGPQSDGAAECYLYWLRRGSSAPNYQQTWTGACAAETTVLCYSGCAMSGVPWADMQGAAVTQVNPVEPDPPSVTALLAPHPFDGCLNVVFGTGLFTGGSWTPPSGYTIREPGGANWARIGAAEKAIAYGATENAGKFTTGDASNRSIWAAAVALKPPGIASTARTARPQMEDGGAGLRSRTNVKAWY